MVATLIEAFGNNFNDDDKCDKCDSRKYLVESCSGFDNYQSLCENALAQYDGVSQNCQHDGKYCTPGQCLMGDKDSIDASCKSTKYGGKLSKPICTGVNLKDCNNSSQQLMPLRIIFDDNSIQNYYCDEHNQNCKFCKWIDGLNMEKTQSDCEPKPS